MSKFNPAPKDVHADKTGKPTRRRRRPTSRWNKGLEDTFPGSDPVNVDAAGAVEGGQGIKRKESAG